MGRSSARGYVEPLAAIAGVFAVVVGLTVYAGAAEQALRQDRREVAGTVLEELVRTASVDGVLDPDRLATAEPPAGWRANVTLATPEGRWTRGPAPPDSADRASRQVAVGIGPGSVRPGRVTVVAWR